MIVAVNHLVGESGFDQLLQRLLRPIRLRESVFVFGVSDLIAFDVFCFPAQSLQPTLLGRTAGRESLIVPRIVEVLRRHDAQEENVMRLGRERQAKALDLLGLQVLLGQVLIDDMKQAILRPDDRNDDEALFRIAAGAPVRAALRLRNIGQALTLCHRPL